MNNKTGVVFDFNGTLIIDHIYHIKAWSQVSEALGGPMITMKDMEKNYSGKNNVDIIRQLSPGHSDDFYESWSRKKEALYRKELASVPGGVPLVKGVREYFDTLKEHQIPFTIATASIWDNVGYFIRHYHLDHWMDPEKIIYDDGRFKDKSEMYRKAGELLGTGDHLLIFEDSLSGIRCASKLDHAKIIAIYSDTLEPFYKDYPSIIGTIHDFTEALPLSRSVLGF